MSAPVSGSDEANIKQMNNLVHCLNPKMFVKMFTKEKCTMEEKLIREILTKICALRNSGGGRLTIWLTETCLSSDAQKCVEIIKDAVDEVLSDTKKTDLLELTSVSRIMFLIRGSKAIVTMKYNMYAMTNEVVKIVPTTKSAAEMRLLLQGSKQESTAKYKAPQLMESAQSDKNMRLLNEKSKQLMYGDITESTVPEISHHKIARPGFHEGTSEYFTNNSTIRNTSVSPWLSPISHFVKGEQVEVPTKYDSMLRFEVLNNISSAKNRAENLILRSENSLSKHVHCLAKRIGGHVYYGISSDGIVYGVNISKKERSRIRKIVTKKVKSMKVDNILGNKVYLRPVKDKNGKHIANLFVIGIYIPPARTERRDHEPYSGFQNTPLAPVCLVAEANVDAKLLDTIEVVKGKNIELLTTRGTVKFKMLKDDKFSSTSSSVADRITQDEYLLACVSAFANHRGGELYYGISSDGIIVGERFEETEIKEIFEKIEKKIASVQVWPRYEEEIHIKFWEISFIPVRDDDYPYLRRYVIKISVNSYRALVFVRDPESYNVVENSVEKIPFSQWIARLQDTSMKVSDKTIFVEFKENENAFDKLFLPNQYEAILKSLEWIESFKIIDENDECDARHLEIVCQFGEVPRTADMVKSFGEDILPFITYKKGSKREWFETNIFDENWDMKEEYEDELMRLPWVEEFYIGVASEPEKSWQIYITCVQNNVPSLVDLKKLFGIDIASFIDFIQESVDEDRRDSPRLSYLRSPIPGDEFCVQEDNGGYGTIGILTGDNEKHYASTCYHACFKNKLPKNDIKKEHEILMLDCVNKSQGCEGATCVYKAGQEERLLGQFRYGLYDDDNDIALIEVNPNINCVDTITFLGQTNITPALASKDKVAKMFIDCEKKLPVVNIRSTETGILFAISGATRCPRNRRCYRIRKTGKKPFAIAGDSGSLVYLKYEGENIPFAYVCMQIPESDKTVYYCRSLDHSIEELIKKYKLEDGMKPCFRECQNNR